MKGCFLILSMVLFIGSVKSQYSAGVKIGGGISRVIAIRDLTNINSTLKFAPSVQGGFFYELQLGKRSVLGAELLFSQIEGKESLTLSYVDAHGNVYAEDGYLKLDYHLSYLAMPFTYGLRFGKLTANLGAQIAYELFNSAHEEGDIPGPGTRVKYENDSPINTDKMDYGIRVAVLYKLSDRFLLEANYYHGLNNIMADHLPLNWNWKNQQFTLGFRYAILKR